MNGRTLDAKVTGRTGRYFVVEAFGDDTPNHLRFHNLIPAQMAGADVGDLVRIQYQVTSRSGLWNVLAVLEPCSGCGGRGHFVNRSDEGEQIPCEDCDGTGRKEKASRT